MLSLALCPAISLCLTPPLQSSARTQVHGAALPSLTFTGNPHSALSLPGASLFLDSQSPSTCSHTQESHASISPHSQASPSPLHLCPRLHSPPSTSDSHPRTHDPQEACQNHVLAAFAAVPAVCEQNTAPLPCPDRPPWGRAQAPQGGTPPPPSWGRITAVDATCAPWPHPPTSGLQLSSGGHLTSSLDDLRMSSLMQTLHSHPWSLSLFTTQYKN